MPAAIHSLAHTPARVRTSRACGRRPWLCWALGSAAGAGLTPALAVGERHRIAYPRPGPQDAIANYVAALLTTALGEAAERYEFVKLLRPDMVQQRVIEDLHLGLGDSQMVFTMSSRLREHIHTPIRIPLDRGVLGWRVPLIRAADRQQWERLRDVNELRSLLQAKLAGQGRDWPDTEILRGAGLPVQTSGRMALYRMLALGRIDHFPRSVLEIQTEAEEHAAEALVIAPRALIVYPTALYFFVSRNEPEFAQALSAGLERAVQSGEMVSLFRKHFGPALAALDTQHRLVLRLHNPLLSPETPLQRSELWEIP